MSSTQNRQLDDILSKMASSIESMMDSLYAIQILAMSTKSRNSPNQAAVFREIRERIFQYWEEITATLKKCNILGYEAMKLATLAKTSTKEEVLALMQKRLSGFKQAGSMSSDVIRQHDAFLRLYSKYAIQIRSTIEEKKPQRASNYSNGEEAMKSFDSSCNALTGHLIALHSFLEEEITAYTRGLAAANSSLNNVTLDDAGAFINKWKRYQPIIVKATTQIQQYSDAVIIPPANTIPSKNSKSQRNKPGCVIL